MCVRTTASSIFLQARWGNINCAQRCVEKNQIVRLLVNCYIGRMKIRCLSLLALFCMATLAAAAQSSSIVGTWGLTAAYKILPDGARASDYGDNPHGLVIFTSDGHYSVQIYRAERLKFASGDKFKGTAEEYKEAVLIRASTSEHTAWTLSNIRSPSTLIVLPFPMRMEQHRCALIK